MFSRFKGSKKDKKPKNEDRQNQPQQSDPQFQWAANMFDKSNNLNGGVYTGGNNNNNNQHCYTTDNLPPNPYSVPSQVKTTRGPQSLNFALNRNDKYNIDNYGPAASLFDDRRDAKTEILYPHSAREPRLRFDSDVQSDVGGFVRRSSHRPEHRRSERRPKQTNYDSNTFQVPLSRAGRSQRQPQTIVESPPSRCAVSSSQSDNDGAHWRPSKAVSSQVPKMGGYDYEARSSRKAENIQIKQYGRSPTKQHQQSSVRSQALSSHSNTMSNSSSPVPDINEKLLKLQRRDQRLWQMACDMVHDVHRLSSQGCSSASSECPSLSRSNIQDHWRKYVHKIQDSLNEVHNWKQLQQQYDKKIAQDAQRIEHLKQLTEKLEQEKRTAEQKRNKLHIDVVQLTAQNSYLKEHLANHTKTQKQTEALNHQHGLSIMSFADHNEYPLGDSPDRSHVNEGLISRPTSFLCAPDSSMSTNQSTGCMPPPLLTPRRTQHRHKPASKHTSVHSGPSSAYASVPSTSYATPLASRQGTLSRVPHNQYNNYDHEDEDDEITVNFGNRDIDSGTSTAGTADTHSSQSAGQKPPKIFAGEAPLYKENFAPGMSIGDLDLSDIEKARGDAVQSGSSIYSAAFPPSIISDAGAMGSLPSRGKSSCSSNKSSTPKCSPSKQNPQSLIVASAHMNMPHPYLPLSTEKGTAIRDALLLVSGHARLSPTNSQLDDDGYATLTNETQGKTQQSGPVPLHLLHSILQSSALDLGAARRLVHLDKAGSVSTDSVQWDRAQTRTYGQGHGPEDMKSMSTSCISSVQDSPLHYWHTNREIVAPLADCPVDGRTINAHLRLTAGLRRTLSDSVLSGSHILRGSRLCRLLYLLVCARARHHWPGHANRMNRTLSACDLTEHGRLKLQFDPQAICESSTSDRLHEKGSLSASSSDLESAGLGDRETLYSAVPSRQTSSDTEDSSTSDQLPPLMPHRRCRTPHRSRKQNSSFTSEDSDDDGRTTVQEWVRQLKKKPSFDERRAVVKYSPPRASILGRDIYRHFGEGERKALEQFAFLKDYTTDASSSGGVTSPECPAPLSKPRRLRRSCSDLTLDCTNTGHQKVYENLPIRKQQERNKAPPPKVAPKPRIHHNQQSVAQMNTNRQRASVASHDSSVLLGDLCQVAADQSFSSGSSISFRSN